MSGPPLVTGATGFAGHHLVEHLLQSHPSVAAWSNPNGRAISSAGDRVSWRGVDLLDGNAVALAIAELQPAAIYHCAGVPHVGESWTDPTRALRVNVLGTRNVLDGVRDSGLDCPVLVTGSAMVYRHSTEPLTEDHPVGPADPYGFSKLAQEMLARRAGPSRVFIARPFNHAGPGQSSSFVTSSFARQVAEIEAGQREPVLRVGNLDTRRDITDVRDTVRAYPLIVARGVPRRPYNVCSGQAYRIRDLLQAIVDLASIAISVQLDQTRLRPSDNPMVVGDPVRTATETGWTPAIPIERTLSDLLAYWRRKIGGAVTRPS